MNFTLICNDKKNCLEKRKKLRESHVLYLKRHKENILIAGPILDECERGFLDTLDGDCALPIGALAKLDQQKNEVKFCYYYENLETIFFERKKIILNSDQARYDCIQIALDLKKRAKKI